MCVLPGWLFDEWSVWSNEALERLIDDPTACSLSCCIAPGKETHFSACRMRLTVPSFRSKIRGVFQFLELPQREKATKTHIKISGNTDINNNRTETRPRTGRVFNEVTIKLMPVTVTVRRALSTD